MASALRTPPSRPSARRRRPPASPRASAASSGRTFSPSDAKGGAAVDPKKTAVVFIEYQNEFAAEGGKLHDAVKGVMADTGMLEKSASVAAAARAAGAHVFHVPISFSPDMSDNPNKGLGILKGIADGELFVDEWSVAICEEMAPEGGDVVVEGKRGLDAFPGSDLGAQLEARGVETVAIAGFLTNCCVESTMRTAYERGYNTVTITDCCASTSAEGHEAAVGGTFGMFSTPMTAEEFKLKL
mmetsp:Transcript_7936/g.27867  ORF Transcript_7936/g.27867 Transcript_7936/m.27867 type:complete len:242 (-) Transcript_7936:760-1485(-)